MDLRESLEAVMRKEEESSKKLADARARGDDIRLKGEEEATEIYRKTREGLKDRTVKFRKDWEAKLAMLEKQLGAKLKTEEKKVDQSLGKKRKDAASAAYQLLVSGFERSP
jgi:hypothetical protein